MKPDTSFQTAIVDEFTRSIRLESSKNITFDAKFSACFVACLAWLFYFAELSCFFYPKQLAAVSLPYCAFERKYLKMFKFFFI